MGDRMSTINVNEIGPESSHIKVTFDSDTIVIPTATSNPLSPDIGEIYFDTSADVFKTYTGSGWVSQDV